MAENRGVPVIRRYPVRIRRAMMTAFTEPIVHRRRARRLPLCRRGRPADRQLTQTNEYALAAEHAAHSFLYPRPFVPTGGGPRLESMVSPAIARISTARSTSKGAFPPPATPSNWRREGRISTSRPEEAGALLADHDYRSSHAPTPSRHNGHGYKLFYDQPPFASTSSRTAGRRSSPACACGPTSRDWNDHGVRVAHRRLDRAALADRGNQSLMLQETRSDSSITSRSSASAAFRDPSISARRTPSTS